MARPTTDRQKAIASLRKSLRAKIRLSWAALTSERLARAFWPSLIVLLGTLGLLIWQVHSLLPYPFDLGLYGVLGASFLFLSVKGIRSFASASMDEAIARLDQSGSQNPITALVDSQFIGTSDQGSIELWRLHQNRMGAMAANVAVNAPHVRLAKRDPWAMRLIVVLFFTSAILFGRANTQTTFVETLQDLASGTTGEVASFEIWADPPAYTGVPSIYLNALAENTILELPEGTQLILRSYGTSSLEIISDVAALDEDQKTFTTESAFKVAQSGSLVLKRGFRTVGQWDITMIPDSPPSVTLTDEVSRTIQGSVQIPYAAKDDYGITGGVVEITLVMDKMDRRYGLISDPESYEPIKFDLPLPFNADAADFEETVIEDLAKHPWSGLPVKITLTVFDAAGNSAAIEPVYTPMPGKRFFDTLAASLAEQRRDVLWNRDNIDRVGMILKTLTYLPEEGFPNQRAYLMVRSVIRRIDYTDTRPIDDDMQWDVGETLWRAALLIEDGDLSDAAERLKRAQERLSEAMKNGATKDEIAELMDELRKATDDYLRQLAQNAQERDQEQADNQNARQVSPEMIQEMMDKIQELMEQGRMAEAQALMDQLQQLLENIQVTKGDPQRGDGDGQGADGFKDTLRQQQELADENFQKMQEEFNRDQDGQSGENKEGQQPGESDGSHGGDAPDGGTLSDLADRQEALRDLMQQQLGGLSQDDSKAGRAARDALEKAERDMGKAGENLKQGKGADALDNQADAVEAMRQGMRRLNEARQEAGQGQRQSEGDRNNETAGPDAQDPLGRSTNKRGFAQTNERFLRSDEQLRRSKEILEEIRRRSGERTRPQLELDYLDRLLDRF